MQGVLLISAAFVILLSFLNGVTDAPNSVATVISSGTMKVKQALIMSSAGNILGAIIFSYVSFDVANTFVSAVNLDNDREKEIIAILASLAAVCFFAFVTAKLGLPASESHGLVSAVSGAALALSQDALKGTFRAWSVIVFGLFLSTVVIFFVSAFFTGKICRFFKVSERRACSSIFEKCEIFGAFASSFMHGAQDSQKFAAVLIMLFGLHDKEFLFPLCSLFCALFIASGTLCGGRKIIDTVASEMGKSDSFMSFSSNLTSLAFLIFCSFRGVPVSTTHIKTCSLAGAEYAGTEKFEKNVFMKIVTGWILTFPVCFLLGFYFAKCIKIIFLN